MRLQRNPKKETKVDSTTLLIPQEETPSSTSTTTTTTTSTLAKRKCMSPICKNRLTIQEATSSNGFEYRYCKKCRAKQTAKTRYNEFFDTVKKYFDSLQTLSPIATNDDKRKFKLRSFLADEFNGLNNFSRPENHSPNSLIYVNFLHFNASKYALIAEILTDIYINPWPKTDSVDLSSIAHLKPPTNPPLPAPTPNDIEHAKRALHIITNTKRCDTCNTMYPTYCLPQEVPYDDNYKEEPGVFIAGRRTKNKQKVFAATRPEAPASAEQVTSLLGYLLERNVKRFNKMTITSAYFAHSYASKDGWAKTCKDCKKMTAINRRK